MKRKLIASIREKELQLAILKVHIDKSEVCSDLYNKMLLEKAILKKQLAILKMACYNCIDLQNNSLVNRIKHLLPRQEKLICDYFRGR